MSLIALSSSPVVLRLNRDLVRSIKRGHPWIYADALRDLPKAAPGSPAVLLDNKKGQPVGMGFYDPGCPVALRICEADTDLKLDDRWAERRLNAAIELRRPFLASQETNGYRLLNGEGDQLPGLIVDLYDKTAVLKRDGDGPEGFWQAEEVAEWLSAKRGLTCVYERPKERGAAGRPLTGSTPTEPVPFMENGLRFRSDVVRGQKTGFFLDQRDNRQLIRQWSSDAKVLNVFSYTGGFSIAAGVGGAQQVTSVDIAAAAIEAANEHWRLNQLPALQHEGVVADAFDFMTQSAAERRRWDVVVLDPPSFAPNRESVTRAQSAYQNMVEQGCRVTANQGILAAASCSSHIDLPMFLDCCEEGISRARRRGTVIAIGGQPSDHPTPLVLPEFRYLKFVLMRLD